MSDLFGNHIVGFPTRRLTCICPCFFFQSGRIGADEEIDDFKGMSEAEVQEILEEREAKANAQILKMVCHFLHLNFKTSSSIIWVVSIY